MELCLSSAGNRGGCGNGAGQRHAGDKRQRADARRRGLAQPLACLPWVAGPRRRHAPNGGSGDLTRLMRWLAAPILTDLQPGSDFQPASPQAARRAANTRQTFALALLDCPSGQPHRAFRVAPPAPSRLSVRTNSPDRETVVCSRQASICRVRVQLGGLGRQNTGESQESQQHNLQHAVHRGKHPGCRWWALAYAAPPLVVVAVGMYTPPSTGLSHAHNRQGGEAAAAELVIPTLAHGSSDV